MAKRTGLVAVAAVIGGAGIYLLTRRGTTAPSPGRANLYGQVTNAVTGSPISGVLVRLNGMEALTDGAGNYFLTDLEPGEYLLQFSKAGYQSLVYSR